MFVLDTDHLGILQRQAEPQYGNLLRRIGMTVLTRNRGDFERIPGLTVEDWTT